ncbi:DUF2188 domain-containing protein [Paracoccus liaowanqingii]|uniref:DUF2188 domain-containing protein n=1 Tax=Paracoccus liaowanqingii TaxID=2560053 RepID=A0A4Z1CRK3_9RHOB|nr:DUF2188 domain-containing protein [Paracoccus liaowanqingii]TGN67908.1 DUF2188 domain-containing protein [Paracoccus liaowanqingii]
MTKIVYEIVEHDGGWAYKLDDVFSETFDSKEQATAAANDVAARQQVSGESETIQYQDEDGVWREEDEAGDDRPDVEVRDAKS